MNIFDFNNIVFDLDSTLTSIEGIDFLAKINDREEEVAELTRLAMNGELDFQEIFAKRLDLIKPRKEQLHVVGNEYIKNVVPGTIELIERLVGAGKEVFVISGGYNPAVKLFTDVLGIEPNHVFANNLIFDSAGEYKAFDQTIPLWKNDGKREVLSALIQKQKGKWVFVGDGMSDLIAAENQAEFICFCGVAARPAVRAKAKYVLESNSLMELCNLNLVRKDDKLTNYGTDF